jgi:hypothetical protein
MFDFVRLTAGAAAILLLPGYALLALARRQLDLDRVEAFCMAVGVSLAAVPLLLYATTLTGITQGPGVVLGLLALCAIVIAWDWWSGRQDQLQQVQVRSQATAQRKYQSRCTDQRWTYAALGIVFLFTLIGRLWSIHGIEYPLWTDAYGHAVVTQMVVDQGAIPTTYEPYAPIADFTYHFGFHALAAWVHWLTGEPVLYSLVILGQLLNVLVIPTTYLFTQRFFNSRVAGLTAAVVVGLLSHMPAQFVNWGRYTQLDGQMLLPVAALLYLAMLQAPARRYRLLLLTAAAFAGLFFVHYRIFIFALLLAGLLWAWAMLQPQKEQTRGRLLLEATLLAGIGVLLLAPWLWRLAMGFGGNYASVAVSGFEEKQHGSYYGFDPKELLDFGMVGYLWALAALGAIWGIWQRNKMVLVLLLWIVSLFAGANLHLLNFTPLYSNTIVIIALYLPLAALIGYLFHELATVATNQFAITSAVRVGLTGGFMIGLVLLGIGAVVSNTRLVAHDNIFVRDADVQAMHWIKQDVPPDALFYIATSFWTPEVAHGLDGGYYLPLLAARQTIVPPQHYASDGTGEYRNLVNQRLYDLAAAQDAPTLWATLNRYGITHIYIGARKTELDPEFFVAHPELFTQIYNHDGVWVFQVQKSES